MSTIRICQQCKKSINHKKDAHHTVRNLSGDGWRGHDYYCYQCGKKIFVEVPVFISSIYFPTLHIHAGKEYTLACYDPSSMLWTVNDDAYSLRDIEIKQDEVCMERRNMQKGHVETFRASGDVLTMKGTVPKSQNSVLVKNGIPQAWDRMAEARNNLVDLLIGKGVESNIAIATVDAFHEGVQDLVESFMDGRKA